MNRNKKTNDYKKQGSILPLVMFFPLFILYEELVSRIATYGDLSFKQFIYILFFSLSQGAFISCILLLIKNKKAVRIVAISVSVVLSVIFIAFNVYFKIFGNYFSWEDIGMAGEAAFGFFDVLLEGIKNCLFTMILLLIPTLILIISRKRFTYYKRKKNFLSVLLAVGACTAVFFIIPSLILNADKEYEGDLYFYNHPNNVETPLNYGLLMSSKLNIEKFIFGEKEDDILPPDIIDSSEVTTDSGNSDETSSADSSSGDIPVEYGYNVLDIDFDALIANTSDKTIAAMHKYFKNVEPTKKNEYTGYFKDKNLIFITLEGFSGEVIDKDLTPTLYMMANGGFVFNNYYCSCWGGSTSTGEYANMTGLFYNSVSCMRDYAGKNYWPFTLGNQMNKLGYTSLAFHANTATYYRRDLSHPQMGYALIAGGTGIETLTDSNGYSFSNNPYGHRYQSSDRTIKPWPPSDELTAQFTVNSFIDKQPFNIYYMSISGHANYNWSGNAMAKLHRDKINEYCLSKGLNYSEETKAYLACQYEVELMAKKLVDELDAAGILDDTVFVMAADHFPYGITDDSSLSELYGLPADGIRKNLDLYRNTLIIWSSSMEEAVVVDTPCSAIDILPTVSNLFGLEYDSRLLMGTDVLSDTRPLVILNGVSGPYWCYIDENGNYKTSGSNLLTNKKYYAFEILKRNYYSYLKDYIE